MKERSITNQKIATQLVRLLRQSGPPGPPRSLRGWRPPCQGWGACPGERKPCAARQDGAPPPGPPVSAAKTTRRARPPSPTNSGYVVSFLRRTSSRALRLPSSDSHPAGEEGVDCQLGSLPQGQPVCNHLDPSSIEAIESSHVEVAHEGVGGHPSPNLAAHLGCSTLKRKLPLSQNPCLGARCSMMAKLVGGHIGMCERTKARASGGVCTAGCGKVGPQFWSWWASS